MLTKRCARVQLFTFLEGHIHRAQQQRCVSQSTLLNANQKPQAGVKPHLRPLPAVHAQNDEAGSQFWSRMLGRALAQLAATPEPLLPWLTEQIERAETRN